MTRHWRYTKSAIHFSFILFILLSFFRPCAKKSSFLNSHFAVFIFLALMLFFIQVIIDSPPETDLEMFSNNGLEYIRRDVEGSDVDTRRRLLFRSRLSS